MQQVLIFANYVGTLPTKMFYAEVRLKGAFTGAFEISFLASQSALFTLLGAALNFTDIQAELISK